MDEQSATESGSRLQDRLEKLFGKVDPNISLHGLGGDESSQAAVDVLRRLATRQVLGNRYEVHECVGRGGMGTVLRVWDQDLRRYLAMKVLQGDVAEGRLPNDKTPDAEMDSASVDRLLDDLRKHVGNEDVAASPAPRADFERVQRFLEEAQITGQLDHPGIVPVHEVGLDDEGHVYFTMKLVKGDTLKTIFDRVHANNDDWTTTRALGLLLRVCEAMAYAHAKGVVHRDLKPANIMVGAYGEVYVMDWGLACLVDRETSSFETVSIDTEFSDDALETPLTPGGHRVVGTPVYMPPEQAAGNEAESVSSAHDVYSIGAMIYHLLARRPPYAQSSSERARDVLARVLAGPPKPLQRAAPEAPAELVAICDKAMSRDRRTRYASTDELAGDLRAYLEHRVVAAYETGVTAELRKWVSRNRVFATMAGTLVLAALAWGVSYVLMSGELTMRHTDLESALAEKEVMAADLAVKNAELDASLEATEELRQLAEAERVRVLRLLASPEAERLASEADVLWPMAPAMIEPYDDWLRRAQALVATLDTSPDGQQIGHRERLAQLRERATFQTALEARADWRLHEDYEEWEKLREGVVTLEGRLEELRAGAATGALTEQEVFIAERIEGNLPKLISDRDALGERVCQRRTYHFADADDALWHDELLRIMGEIEVFADSERGLITGTSPAHGWGVKRRRDEAQRLTNVTLTGLRARNLWTAAIASISDVDACPMYDGLELTPQFGLLPVGRDPASGLWEFWHAPSGSEPRRGSDGTLQFALETGVILVLVPGGPAHLGAQSSNPGAPNFDPHAMPSEGPVHDVELEAFFISKYELSQGQWAHMTGMNPSHYPPGRAKVGEGTRTLLRPVENVTWSDSRDVMHRYGLMLPSESQWEYAARAGTDTPWWTGSTRETLVGAVNMFDEAGERGGANLDAVVSWPGFNDGHIIHAAINVGRANPFGLHGVHGNVREWCADVYFPNYAEADTELRVREHVIRGGSFTDAYNAVRSAVRGKSAPDMRNIACGVRPARAIDR